MKKDPISKKPYRVIYFNYDNDLRFTYLNEVSLRYWLKKGLKQIKIGDIVNVQLQKDKKHFKIIHFYSLNKNKEVFN